jgi:hypothetical protein
LPGLRDVNAAMRPPPHRYSPLGRSYPPTLRN